jgi:hypothetical protein
MRALPLQLHYEYCQCVKAINEEDRGSRDKIDIRLIYEIAMSI